MLPLRHVVGLLIGCSLGCGNTVKDQQPVGGAVDTDAAIQRYLRHVYLDTTGKPPSDDDLAASTQRLRDAHNTPSARGALVDELMAKPEFGKVWIEELENSIFGGNTLDDQYAFVCGIIRGTDPTCSSCTSMDSCSCQCSILPMYFSEREALRTTADDFSGGMASADIERRYALAYGYYAVAGAPETRVTALFQDFLARPAEADEIENGRAMIFGAIIPGSPAGLLFHRLGANYNDLVDILFTSEVYRAAIVRRVFDRYLARLPSSLELQQFTPTIDATSPDARPLVRSVLSSREYFDQ
jgi:hypothetical protein